MLCHAVPGLHGTIEIFQKILRNVQMFDFHLSVNLVLQMLHSKLTNVELIITHAEINKSVSFF